ncbi:MAG: transposase, partial [Thermoplasmatales archaeon]
KKYRKERNLLGLKQTPNQRTISHFIHNILDNETKELIKFIAQKIETISDKFGFFTDRTTLKPEKPKRQFADRTIFHLKKQKTHEISKLFKKRFASILNLNIHNNAVYSKNEFIDLLLYMCKTKDFAENGSKSYREEKDRVPQGETFLYHLKNYQDTDQIKRMFITIFEMIWETARQSNLFNRRIDLAVDYTEIPFYGDKNAPMIVEKKPEKGTTHCYKYATINIVERNKRFVLLALPVGKFDTKEKILHQLLSYTLQRVKIKRLYADRAFFSKSCIEIFKRYQIKFIIPATENPRIKKILEVMPAPTVIRDYEMGYTRFSVAIAKDEKGINRAFATNIDFNENDVNFSERLFLLYGRRWGVETTYRVLKHTFWPKTTSKNYFIRLFYFLFSTLLYNMWILADVIICISIYGKKTSGYIVASKHFVTILLTIDPGG